MGVRGWLESGGQGVAEFGVGGGRVLGRRWWSFA